MSLINWITPKSLSCEKCYISCVCCICFITSLPSSESTVKKGSSTKQSQLRYTISELSLSSPPFTAFFFFFHFLLLLYVRNSFQLRKAQPASFPISDWKSLSQLWVQNIKPHPSTWKSRQQIQAATWFALLQEFCSEATEVNRILFIACNEMIWNEMKWYCLQWKVAWAYSCA